MMKNLLLTAALASACAAGMAQGIEVSASSLKAQLNEKMATKQVVSMKGAAVAKDAAIAPTGVLDGVFYYRPEGALYSAYTFGEDLAAIHVPALTDLTFYNGCSNPAAAKWSINGQDLSEYTDDDNNLVFQWYPSNNEDGISGYYAPTISVRNNSFCVTDVAMVANDICPMLHINTVNCRMYTGFTDGQAFGSGSVLENAVTSQTGAVIESYRVIFEKPASPMYVQEFSLPFWTEKSKPLPEGTVLTLKLYKYTVDAEGRIRYDEEPTDVIESTDVEILGSFSEGGYYGEVHFAKVEKGVFGEDLITPMIIDYAYALDISGHNQAGVDVRYRMSDFGEDPYENEMGPHTFLRANNGDGTYSYYYFNSAEKEYGYELPIYVYALYDKVEVASTLYDQNQNAHEHLNILRVSADGKTVENENGKDLMGSWVAFTTALPMMATDEDGEEIGENYDIEDLPDWIQIYVDDTPWAEQALNYMTVECEPLPADETGRQALLYIVGKGVTSAEPVVILQGDAELSIEAIKAEMQNHAAYNVAGQKAEKNAKGFIICKGAKQLRK